MALDPSIILQAGRGVTPLLSNAEIQDQQMQREGNSLKLNALRQSMADDQSARDIARSTAPEGLAGAYYRAGLVKPAQEAQKFQTEQQKATREAEKSKLEAAQRKFEFVGQVMSGVVNQETYDVARRQLAEGLGQEAMASIPPTYDPEAIERNRRQALSVKDQMDQRLRALAAEETRRHHQATEATSAGNLEVARGNLEVNRGNLAVSNQRLSDYLNAPKGQVVQTESGPVIVDTKTATSRPVLDESGAPARRPGKDIPANINKSIIENQQNISKIDKAMESIQARPGSLSPLFALPGSDMAGQYIDPKGVEARAGVADIGSLILHDRSGAAVTASETPRLKPFIPQASDRPEVALKKLQRFKQIYEEEAGLLAQTYSKDQGYKESPALKNTRAAQAPTASNSSKMIKRRGSFNGRKVVEYTDGSIDYVD